MLRVLGEHGTTLELMKWDDSTRIAAIANVKRWRGQVPSRPLQWIREPEVVMARKQGTTGGGEWSSDSSNQSICQLTRMIVAVGGS